MCPGQCQDGLGAIKELSVWRRALHSKDTAGCSKCASVMHTSSCTRQAENIPIILVGNKTDLVRSREVSVEEGRACAVVFDC
ncbi:GTP-binding protein GEM-like [Xenopus laevis]|uniref:GTP-binding protein GEM-like n=1 Tax=Xenopus laevis TaxID=8355 RepID=A0A8J1M0K4_XENLA|nr:GTP-binding protein GEM-like [Xenopus laevis]